MTEQGLSALIDKIWADAKHTSKIDWLRLERIIRATCQKTVNGELTDRQAIIVISESLGAITGRGVAI